MIPKIINCNTLVRTMFLWMENSCHKWKMVYCHVITEMVIVWTKFFTYGHCMICILSMKNYSRTEFISSKFDLRLYKLKVELEISPSWFPVSDTETKKIFAYANYTDVIKLINYSSTSIKSFVTVIRFLLTRLMLTRFRDKLVHCQP